MAIQKIRHTNIIAAYLVLNKNGQTLLLKRQNTGYHDGDYSLVAGHVDPGESFTTCMVREAKEEADITINPDDLTVAHTMHRKSKSDGSERVDIFFTTKKWHGKIKNCEPHKCAELTWFKPNKLPENIVPCVGHALKKINSGVTYSEYGW